MQTYYRLKYWTTQDVYYMLSYQSNVTFSEDLILKLSTLFETTDITVNSIATAIPTAM